MFNNQTLKLLIYDTSGQEKYSSVISTYYRKANGIILVYDVASKKSFDKVNFWVGQVNENLGSNEGIFILFGNKTDLESERAVTSEEGKLFANKYGFIFLEGSAKTGQNINELFIMLVKGIMFKQSGCQEKKSNIYSKVLNLKNIKKKEKCC